MPRKVNKKNENRISGTYNEMIEKNKKINNSENSNNINKGNYIIAEININRYNINEDIRIINSFEASKKQIYWINGKNYYLYENEKEIKEKCIIKINDKIIPFSYFNKFNKEGIYEIKYIFKENIIKSDFMFCDCKFISNLNLSSFNTQNITNMGYMFYGCNSLANLNLFSLILKMLLI